MVARRPRFNRKSQETTEARGSRGNLFGPPPLLPGEDAAARDELVAQVFAAIEPRDRIEEMWVNDLVALESDIMRFRGLKTSILREIGRKALGDLLFEELDYERYRQHFLQELFENIEHLTRDDEDAEDLVRRYDRGDVAAVDRGPQASHDGAIKRR
jgi:hypothetical protein